MYVCVLCLYENVFVYTREEVDRIIKRKSKVYKSFLMKVLVESL